MVINVNDPSLVVLIGASGSGKSTFARSHFKTVEILSSDFCRALVSNDEADQGATDDAFQVLHLILAKRLKRQLTTVIDATNVQRSARIPLVAAAKSFGIQAIAIVFEIPASVCHEQNAHRSHRQVPSKIIDDQIATMISWTVDLGAEGFAVEYKFFSSEEMREAEVIRTRSYSWRSERHGSS